MATPGLARRSLDLPPRRLEIGTKASESKPEEGAASVSRGVPRAGDPVRPADVSSPPPEKENPPTLRKSESGQRYLEIPKISRDRTDDTPVDPNQP